MLFFQPETFQNRFGNKQKGFSLIDSILAVVIVSSIVFLLANIPNAISLISKSKHLSIAKEIATKAIEDKRSMNFSNIVNGNNTPLDDARVELLPSGTAFITVADCGITLCPNFEVAKTVSVVINWNEAGKQNKYKIDTLISEEGF